MHKKGQSYLDKTFLKEDYSNHIFENCQFESCVFKECKFKEAQFKSCQFQEVEFITCDLANADFPYSRMREVAFIESRATGINWARLALPEIRLESPMDFYRSDISFSSFMDLSLNEINFEACKAHEVDFRGCDLSFANFTESDLYGAQFGKTNLKSANFSGALNYLIDPRENTLTKARFSLLDAAGLLKPFGILLDGE